VLLQQLQARLIPAGDQSGSCEPKSIQAEIDLDHAINYVLEKNAELLDRFQASLSSSSSCIDSSLTAK